jgi:hypothetical protein
MINDTIKSILTSSGCDLVIYEHDRLANLYTDQSNQNSIIGIVMQPNQITLEVRANSIMERYPFTTIEVLKQVKLEDKADNNEVVLQELLEICKQIITRLILSELVSKVRTVTATKIQENRYDANAIGWSISVNILRLLNEDKDPC